MPALRGVRLFYLAIMTLAFGELMRWVYIRWEPVTGGSFGMSVPEPSVLGWAGFRDVAQRYSLGMTEQLLSEAIKAGQLARQPVRALAHVLIGALDEAAMLIATAEDPKKARRETRQVLRHLVDAMFQ